MSETYTAQLDLSFQPVVNLQPKVLTSAQLQAYNEQGYLFPFHVFTPTEAQRNRAYFDYLLAEMRVFNDGRDTYAINGYHERCRGLYRIATDPRILNIVEDIVGPDIICWGTHFFCKLPHDPKAVPWHQDASYWPLRPARTVTVWLAIDDVDEENAAMQVIPRTHDKGHLKWRTARTPAVLDQEIEDIEQYGKPVSIAMGAGQIELHADMLVHGSPPNHSARRRCGLTLRYCPPTVRPLKADWGANAILCRGQDTTGHWVHKVMPPGENVASQDKPISIGGN
ncbi:MAG: phytanoyl-CoA dioxygenase family protein [Phycisphaerae bacterium]